MKKICPRCKEEKDIEEFYRFKYGKDGRCHFCKKCDNKRKTELLRRKSLERNKRLGRKTKYYTLDSKIDRENGVKYCPRCKEKKTINEFLFNNAARDKVDFFCIECKRKMAKDNYSPEKAKKKYKRNKRLSRNYKLFKKYGITIEQYEKKLADQNNKCDICGITPEENGKSFAVDHDHYSNKIRGLLCNNCNVAVGFLHDNIIKAKKLISYIEKYTKGDIK